MHISNNGGSVRDWWEAVPKSIEWDTYEGENFREAGFAKILDNGGILTQLSKTPHQEQNIQMKMTQKTQKTSAILHFINSLNSKQRKVFNVVHVWVKDYVKYNGHNVRYYATSCYHYVTNYWKTQNIFDLY